MWAAKRILRARYATIMHVESVGRTGALIDAFNIQTKHNRGRASKLSLETLQKLKEHRIEASMQ
jgi:hypothetical protein